MLFTAPPASQASERSTSPATQLQAVFLFQLRRVYTSVLLKYLQGLGATYRAIPLLVAYPDIFPAFLAATVARRVACGLWPLLTHEGQGQMCKSAYLEKGKTFLKHFALGRTGSDSPLRLSLRGNPSHRPRLQGSKAT